MKLRPLLKICTSFLGEDNLNSAKERKVWKVTVGIVEFIPTF